MKINKENTLNSVLFFISSFLYLFFYFYFYTPSSNIVFYDMDSKRIIDEIIQIFNPSSFYDFIYDVMYGELIAYGRLYYTFFAFLVYITGFITSKYLFIGQVVTMINALLFCFSIGYLCKKLISNKYIQVLTLILCLSFETSSIVQLKTTSFEFLILTISVHFAFFSKSKMNFYYAAFFMGILFGIKFVNLPFAIVLFVYILKNKNFVYSLKSTLFFLLGIFFCQPILLHPKGLRNYILDIFSMVNYQEGTTDVNPLDWIKLIYETFGSLFLLFLLIIVIYILFLKKFNRKNSFQFLFFSSIGQIILFFFSSGLIRAHYLKIPVTILIILGISFIELNLKITKTVAMVLIITSIFSYLMIFNESKDLKNLYNYESLEKIKLIEENNTDFILINQIYNYLQTDPIFENNKLIWWQPSSGRIYPYSDFHWGSSEDPDDASIYIKEIWGPFQDWFSSECANFGGAMVLIEKQNETLLASKRYKLIKIFEKNNLIYYVYYADYFKHPIGC